MSLPVKVKAVIDFKEYERLKNMGLDLGCKGTDIKLVVQNDEMAEGELGAKIFNKSVDASCDDFGKKQVFAVEKGSVEKDDDDDDDDDGAGKESKHNDDGDNKEKNSSFKNLSALAPPAYRERTNKLLDALDLSDYQGGTFALDGQTYDYTALTDILSKLYGRGGRRKRATEEASSASEAKLGAFLDSISARKGLKKLVKNKRLFKKEENRNENWWKLI